jgi:hypothetical protein
MFLAVCTMFETCCAAIISDPCVFGSQFASTIDLAISFSCGCFIQQGRRIDLAFMFDLLPVNAPERVAGGDYQDRVCKAADGHTGTP